MEKTKKLWWWLPIVPLFFTAAGFLTTTLIGMAVSESVEISKAYADERISQVENKIDIIINKQEVISNDVSYMRGKMDGNDGR